MAEPSFTQSGELLLSFSSSLEHIASKIHRRHYKCHDFVSEKIKSPASRLVHTISPTWQTVLNLTFANGAWKELRPIVICVLYPLLTSHSHLRCYIFLSFDLPINFRGFARTVLHWYRQHVECVTINSSPCWGWRFGQIFCRRIDRGGHLRYCGPITRRKRMVYGAPGRLLARHRLQP